MAVGVLFFNELHELLIVKPNYKDSWSIPGGVIDENESPREACLREVKEEVGLTVKKVKLLGVDYMSPETSEYQNKSENLQFIFYGGILTQNQMRSIKLQKEELDEYKFLKLENALPLLNRNLSSRIPPCLEALKNNTAVYLEGGKLRD
ncbi:MAG: NUDIX hydrolase [Parcubacteria group bacterium]|nr:NUDIX hydrolase [Parcubacteria group bacterium]